MTVQVAANQVADCSAAVNVLAALSATDRLRFFLHICRNY